MTCLFKVNEEFSISDGGELIRENYRLMCEMLPGFAVEFFFYLKPSEPQRFFIIRVAGVSGKDFVKAVERFRDNMNFTVQNKRQKNAFFARTAPLESYC